MFEKVKIKIGSVEKEVQVGNRLLKDIEEALEVSNFLEFFFVLQQLKEMPSRRLYDCGLVLLEYMGVEDEAKRDNIVDQETSFIEITQALSSVLDSAAKTIQEVNKNNEKKLQKMSKKE